MREAHFQGTISGSEIRRRRGSRQANAVVLAALVLAFYSLNSRVAMTPESMTFSSVTVGTGSILKTVKITNHGVTEVHAHPLLEGDSTSDFRLEANACETIKGGADCSVSVTFRPSTPGLKSARMVLADFDGARLETEISGMATAAPLAVTPGSIQFELVSPGQMSKENLVRVSSAGPFHIRDLTLAGQAEQFQIVKTNCQPADTAMTTCAVAVAFLPQAVGEWNAELVIDNDGAGGRIVIPLSGTSQQYSPGPSPPPETISEEPSKPPIHEPVRTPPVPGINVAPASLTFDSTKRKAVTIYNTGEAPLQVSVQMQGDSPDRFVADDQNCTSTIPARGSCQITVGYKSKIFGQKPKYDARLAIAHNVPNVATQDVALEWNKPAPSSQPQPHALVTPGSIDFTQAATTATRMTKRTAYGAPESQGHTITIKNDGPVDLKNINLRIGIFGQGNDSGFTFTSNCRSLAQGAECTETVTFTPTKVKNYHETLYVFEGPLTSLGTVDLTADLSRKGPG